MLLGSPSVAISRGHISFGGFVRVVLDPLLIVLCLLLSCAVARSGFGAAELVLAVIVFSLTFPSEVSLHKLRQNLFGTIFINWALLVALLVFFGYATRFIAGFDLHMLAIWFLSTPFVLYVAHRAIPILVPQLLAIDGYRSAVVVSANEVGRSLAANLVAHPALGFRFLGFFDDDVSNARSGLQANSHFSGRDGFGWAVGAQSSDTSGDFFGREDVTVNPSEAETLGSEFDTAGPLLGTINAASSFVKANRVEAVFIALPMAAQPRLLQLLDEIKDTTASVYFVPDIFITDLINARIDDINGMPVVAVCESPIVGMSAFFKRVFDVLIGLIALLAFSPLMLFEFLRSFPENRPVSRLPLLLASPRIWIQVSPQALGIVRGVLP